MLPPGFVLPRTGTQPLFQFLDVSSLSPEFDESRRILVTACRKMLVKDPLSCEVVRVHRIADDLVYVESVLVLLGQRSRTKLGDRQSDADRVTGPCKYHERL